MGQRRKALIRKQKQTHYTQNAFLWPFSFLLTPVFNAYAQSQDDALPPQSHLDDLDEKPVVFHQFYSIGTFKGRGIGFAEPFL